MVLLIALGIPLTVNLQRRATTEVENQVLIQAQGIASQMMYAVHSWARQHEYESIRFECHNQHRPMLHLAIALGYDIVGIRWDPDRGDNLVIFEKVLS